MKLNIACGQGLQAGWTGFDIVGKEKVAVPEGAEYIQHNVLTFPWPIASGSVDEAECSHFVEHIPHQVHWFGYPLEKDGLFMFMEEVYRVLRPEGTITITCPYYLSQRAVQDPTHCRGISENTFMYFDPKWMESMAMSHYGVKTDFEVTTVQMIMDEAFINGTKEEKDYARKHIPNAVHDICVVLKKRKRDV